MRERERNVRRGLGLGQLCLLSLGGPALHVVSGGLLKGNHSAGGAIVLSPDQFQIPPHFLG